MLSVVICAWNEEKNLANCLRSVESIADEIIVVIDDATTDQTARIAKQYKTKIFKHPHTGIVEIMRNFAIAKAKGDWILLLDADESVSESLQKKISEIHTKAPADYYRIPRKNLIFGHWIKSDHWWPDYVYRLFKKGAVTWQDEIHSIPITSGVGADLPATEDNALVHNNYPSVTQYIDRLNRYTDFQLNQLIEQKTKYLWTDLITRPVGEFNSQYFARRGYLMGLHGLVLSLLQSFSEFVLYLKLWQSTGFKTDQPSANDLKKLVGQSQKDTLWWYYESKIRESSQAISWYWKIIRRLVLFFN